MKNTLVFDVAATTLLIPFSNKDSVFDFCFIIAPSSSSSQPPNQHFLIGISSQHLFCDSIHSINLFYSSSFGSDHVTLDVKWQRRAEQYHKCVKSKRKILYLTHKLLMVMIWLIMKVLLTCLDLSVISPESNKHKNRKSQLFHYEMFFFLFFCVVRSNILVRIPCDWNDTCFSFCVNLNFQWDANHLFNMIYTHTLRITFDSFDFLFHFLHCIASLRHFYQNEKKKGILHVFQVKNSMTRCTHWLRPWLNRCGVEF